MLLFSLLTASAVSINPILPDCVTNFTTFFNQYANGSYVDIYRNYSSVSGTHCGTLCFNDTNCTSFNYFPENIFSSSSRSLCQLIGSPFNRSTLVSGNYMGYFLRSENTCDVSNVKDIIIICSLSVLSLVALFACCRCCRRRRQYQELH